MLKRIIAIIPVCLISLCSLAQSIAQLQNPQIVPPSPDAAALGKYGQIPVDKSTGVPSISIPLYEIKTPRFSVPVSLSYHASGVRVDEIASWAGLGWSLNAGGVITRSVMGLPDDWSSGFIYTPVLSADSIVFPADSQWVQSTIRAGGDTQPDNFFYNFNDKSGAFVFGINKQPVLIPYSAVKVSFDTVSGFHILDEQGNHYSFNTTERVNSVINGASVSPISSWYLTQMISADLSDTVQFIYSTDSLSVNDYSFSFTENLGPQYNVNQLVLSYVDFLFPVVGSTSIRTYTPVRIKSIVFKGGKVDFVGIGGRLDNANISLDSVLVSNYNSATGQYSRLKSFALQTNYFYSTLPNPGPFLGSDEPSKHRLILTGLTENDQNDTVVKIHQFAYNQTMLPPVHNFGQDQWGYYNGQYQNSSLLQSQQVTGSYTNTLYTVGDGIYGANRNVSSTYAQAGVLTQITYPTKGFTQFNYESNQQASPGQVTAVLRAGTEGYYEPTDTVYYTPTTSELSSGGDVIQVQINALSGLKYPYPVAPFVQMTDMTAGSIMFTKYADTYTNVDSIFYLSLIPGHQYQLIANAQATGANQYSPMDSLPNANISTSFLAPSGSPTTPVGGLRIASIQDFDSDSTLLSTETYKYGVNESGGGNVLSGSFMTTQITHNAYFYVVGTDDGGSDWSIWPGVLTTFSNSSIYQLSSLSGSPVGYSTVDVYNGTTAQNTGKTMYNYAIWSDSILYCPGAYDNGIKLVPVTWKNGEPTREDHYRSTGGGEYTLEQDKQYSYDYISRTNGRGLMLGYTFEALGFNPQSNWPFWPISNFYWFNYPISSGIRVPSQTVVNNYDSTGQVVLLSDTTSYFYDDSTLFMPTRTASTDSKGHSKLLYTYRPLDETRINALTPLSGSAIVAIDSMVGRNMISPVLQQVEFRNGYQTELSLTNYQVWSANVIAPQNIQIQLAANPIETRLQFNAYDSRGNVLELQKTGNVKEAYLWGYNGLYPVAKILNTTNAVAQTYVTQSVLDNPASDAALRTQLNNLRSISGALVSTYTYLPMVGMTSQVDPQGKTVFYQYDALQRLSNLQDYQGNIIKNYQYHYQH